MKKPSGTAATLTNASGCFITGRPNRQPRQVKGHHMTDDSRTRSLMSSSPVPGRLRWVKTAVGPGMGPCQWTGSDALSAARGTMFPAGLMQ